jgi:hypothetical protein
MNTPCLFFRAAALGGTLLIAGSAFAQTPPVMPTASPAVPVTPPPLKDAAGRSIRRAPTGHLTNYYEEKVAPYTLPDPLVLLDGRPVRDADTWFKLRRPEILKLYETEIYGRVPTNVPKVRFEVLEKDVPAFDGAAVRKHIVGHFGEKPGGPAVNVMLYVPAKATGPVPVVLHITFGGDPVLATALPADRPGEKPAGQKAGTGPVPAGAPPPRRFNDIGPVAEVISHDYAYAILRYTEIQPDNVAGKTEGVIGLTLAPGQTAPAPDEWGTISAWTWGLSRIVDYLETDSAVNAKRIALVGHSRLGKTVLWSGAMDQRYALIYSSQGGEMGSALARRDYGETVDDMAANYGYQFAGNFQKYPGHWNDMPVDAHMLISLSAPRPVFVSGGSGDQWSDPHGEFLGLVAAGPVWKLFGQPDLGATEMPALDVPVASGTLAFLNHDGPHAITPLDWKTFLGFADRFLKPQP